MNRYFKNKLSLFLVLTLVFLLASFTPSKAGTAIISSNTTIATVNLLAGDTLIINNNATLQVTGNCIISGVLIDQGTLSVNGSFLANGSGQNFISDSLVVKGAFTDNSFFSFYSGRVIFDGALVQVISTNQSLYFFNLSVSNSAKRLANNVTLVVGGELDLQAVIVATALNDTLAIDSAGYISNIAGFTNHYVQGPMFRRGRHGIGIDPVGMIFPVADALGNYRPLVLYSMQRYILNTDKPILKVQAIQPVPPGATYGGGTLFTSRYWNTELVGGKLAGGAIVEVIFDQTLDVAGSPPGTLSVLEAISAGGAYSSLGNLVASSQGIISYKKAQFAIGAPTAIALGTGCTPVVATLAVAPNDTICKGAAATFSVTTSGAAIYDSVFYYVNGVFAMKGISGSTFTTTTLNDKDTVTALILKGLCIDTMTKKIVMTVLDPSPNAGQDQTICAGNTATLGGSSLGGGIWTASSGNPPGGGTFAPNNTTLNATYTPSAVDKTINSVTLTLTSKYCPLRNDKMVLTILPSPLITAQPTSKTVAVGASATFSVTATGGSLTYQWQENGVNLTNGPVYSNVKTATMTITGATAAMSGNTYRAVVSGTCSPAATSQPATLTVLGVAAGSCDSNWTVVGSPFCVASPRTILTPAVTGGVFSGTGVMLSGGNYYFDPSLSGPGTFSIKYKRPCGDSLIKSVVVDPAPCVTTIVSGGPGGGSILVSNPQGIYTGCDGSIYYSSTDSNRIYKVDPFGVLTLLAGPAGLNGPTALVVNPANGDIYFSDTKNNQVKKISGGIVTVIAGTGGPIGYLDNAVGASAKFNSPVGLVANATFTKLYIADIGNRRIREIALSGTFPVTTLAGTGATGSTDGPALSATFNNIQQLAADNNFIYISDKGSRRIRKINLTTNQVSTIVKNTGIPTTGYADGPQGVYEVQTPVGISVDGSGIVYFTDLDNCSVRTFDTTSAIVTTIAGGPPPNPSCGFVNGSGTTARFDQPTALSVFVKGFIDVADTKNNAIRRFAIQNWTNNPFIGFKTQYCSYDPKDTLVPQFTGGTYLSSPVSRAVYQSGGRWYFNPDSAGPGTHRVGYRYTSGYCSDTIFQDVVVHPVVKPNLGPDQNICQNAFGSFSLNGGMNGTKPYTSYAWTNLTTGLNPGNSQFYTIPAPGPAVGSFYSIKLIVVDTNGCVGGDTTKITSIVTYSVTLGQDQSVCEGTTVSLTPTVLGGGTATSVLWQDSTSASPYSVKRGGVYSVRVSYANGCSNSDTVNVTYKFPAPLTIASTKAETCNRTITAFAGTGVIGSANGAKAAASFNFPTNMVKDKAGNIYVTDFGNNKIRKITPAGVVSDYAGTGVAGSTGTTLVTATFNQPFGIAIDKNDNLYITEQGASNIIRKITPGGQVSIFAGVTMAGGWNGDGRKDTIRFWTPAGIVVDGGGNIYVADLGNNVVRKVSPLGLVKTLGLYTIAPADVDGNFSTAKYRQPQSLAIDYSGYIYVGNTNGMVRKIDPFKKTVNSYSNLGNLISVNGLAIDNGRNLYAGEKNNFTINYINPKDSTNINYAGQAGVPGPTNGVTPGVAQLDNPNGLFLDGPIGAPLYVLDKHTIRRVADSCTVGICPAIGTTLSVPAGFSNWSWKKVGFAGVLSSTASLLVNATSPAAAPGVGTYYVTATGANGCSSVDTIKVVSLPLPVADAGLDAKNCGPFKNTQIGTVGVPGNQYSWTASPSVGAIPSIAQPTIASIPTTTTFTLTVTGANGCTNTDVVVDSVRALPNFTLGSDIAMCNRGDSVLSGPSIAGATYSWTSTQPFKPGFIATNSPVYLEPLRTVPVTDYYLTVTANGCTKKDTLRITLNPLPPAPIDAGPFYTSPSCRGAILQLGAATGNYNLYKYKWDYFNPPAAGGGYSNDTLFNPTYKLLDDGGNGFVLTVTDRLTGCDSTVFGGSTVKPSPKVGFISPPTCFPAATSFQDTTVLVGSGVGVMTWKWYFGDALVSPPLSDTSNLQNPSYTYPSPGLYNVKLVVTTDSKCADSITKPVNVNGITANFTAPSKICSGKPVTYTNTSNVSPLGTSTTCVWDFGDGTPTVNTINNVSPAAHIFPVAASVQTYNVTLTVTAANGCTDSFTQSITVYPFPLATITPPSPINACEGTPITLTVSAAYAGAPYKVTWRELNSNTVLSPASQTTLPVTTSGKYRATVTDTLGGCADSSFVVLNFLDTLQNLAVVAPASTCSNAPLKLIATVTGGDSLQYSWTTSNGNGVFSNASNDTTFYTPALTDVSPLSFKVKASNRCKADSVTRSINLLAAAPASFVYVPIEPFMNDLITFTPDTSGGGNIIKWKWNFKEGNALDSLNFIATHAFLHAGSFPVTFTIVNIQGCSTVVTNNVDITGPVIYIPNVFKPSTADPDNSVCKVYGTSVAPDDFSFRIYDKWGSVVYQTMDFTQANQSGWNGKNMSGGDPLPMGVYTWAVKGHFYDGTTFQKEGTVTLVR